MDEVGSKIMQPIITNGNSAATNAAQPSTLSNDLINKLNMMFSSPAADSTATTTTVPTSVTTSAAAAASGSKSNQESVNASTKSSETLVNLNKVRNIGHEKHPVSSLS